MNHDVTTVSKHDSMHSIRRRDVTPITREKKIYKKKNLKGE